MCGITGIINFSRESVNNNEISNLTTSISHRGPDDWGFLGIDQRMNVNKGRHVECLKDCWLAFGHRRLSIIDLTQNGWQPMSSEDKFYHIVFNGEIYNFLELRDELTKLNYTFFSTSDTEVLLKAYIQWGSSMLQKLIGMFAFVILDLRQYKLFLCRDFFGIKPLYYVQYGRSIAFASEIKALLTLPNVSKEANAQRVYEYLRLGRSDFGGETFFKNIKQIPAAHFLEIPLNNETCLTPTKSRYWSPDFSTTSNCSSEDAAIKLRNIFQENISLHLRSDVPIGTALSGGIDSSSVIGMTRFVSGSSLNIQAFTYIAETQDLSEENWARIAADNSADQMKVVCPNESDLFNDIQRLTYSMDEPFGSTSMFAQNLVYKSANQNGIKVMLDGQGADELLAGYRYFYPARIAGLFTSLKINDIITFLFNAKRTQPDFNTFLYLSQSIAMLLPEFQNSFVRSLTSKKEYPDWMAAKWCQKRDIHIQTDKYISGLSPLKNRLFHALTVHSLPALLRWQDRNSMAHSVESRVPFLTPSMANFIFSLPDEFLIDANGTLKCLLRKAMSGVVPKEILDRKDKIAFATPMQKWLEKLKPWVDTLLQSEIVASIPLFKRDALLNEWKRVCDHRSPFDWRVWRWISLINWVDCFDVTFDD